MYINFNFLLANSVCLELQRAAATSYRKSHFVAHHSSYFFIMFHFDISSLLFFITLCSSVRAIRHFSTILSTEFPHRSCKMNEWVSFFFLFQWQNFSYNFPLKQLFRTKWNKMESWFSRGEKKMWECCAKAAVKWNVWYKTWAKKRRFFNLNI